MDNFVFRYENLLKIREKEEEQCKNRLASESRDLMVLNQKLDEIEARQKSFLIEVEVAVSEGCSVQKLREAEAEKKWLKETSENQKVLISMKEQAVFEARKTLEEAMKRKKILEKLREYEYEEFQQQIEASEEQLSDQLVSFRDAVNKRK